MKRSFAFITFFILLIVILSVGQVVVSNRISTSGAILSRLESAIKTYEKENYILSERLFLTSSLTNIASSAAELGFVSEKSQVSLTSPLPLAIKQ